ncbi:tripartite tricarboxylate transporter TctB family protein [Aminivibrio sp.]|jgi:hypothetical protein|uniref:tripartite tricarboxylate transporter TctB family protein n=1 Tax=Aminivibrio sp. TaxID=1872489 RepID=UPI001A379AC9|nr:tripartite tricarboxylate transporter TctB family protein [Aminivibrio sp.]MBL3538174.1 tripartite tricarboxylate transporter TctB family protein [Aminivibrio sp.]
MTQRKQDIIFGATGTAISLVVLWLSVQYPSDSALFPLLSASGIFVCSLAVLIMAIKSKEGSEKVEGINLRSAALFGAVLLLYVLSIEKAGFFSSSFFFVMAVSMLWGGFGKGVSLRFSLLFAALFTVFLYITFVKIFTVPLPKGFLL